MPLLLPLPTTYNLPIYQRLFIQDEVKVLFNGNDVNPANEFEDFIQYMTWVMTTTHAEKSTVYCLTRKFCHPKAICGVSRTHIGRERANAALELSTDMPLDEHGSRDLEEALWEMMDRANDTDGVDLIIGPLRGAFFHINEFFPGTFTPTIEIQLHNVLSRFMLCRTAHATGQGAIPAAANRPSMTIVEAKTPSFFSNAPSTTWPFQ